MTASLPASEPATRELADLIEKLTSQLHAGEINWAELEQDHPRHVAEVRRLLPTLAVLADLSRSFDSAGPVTGEAGHRELGDFRIIREVGRGGMGVVYEAEQISLGRRVALKLLPLAGAMDPRHLQRFQIEARAAAGLHHPHIVPVYAVGSDRGVHYYAMQFVNGQTLAELIARSRERSAEPAAPTVAVAGTTIPGPTLIDPRNAARLIADAAGALDYAHSLGIVHRDIKPGNLMVDAHGTLWVTDFGLAKMGSDAGLTMSGDLLGTLRYMSPEQALAQHGLVDHRADVYALGATLYELLTRVPAVPGEDRAEVLHRLLDSDPAPPRKLSPTLPRDLETIVLKCLEREPTRRYQSARELGTDLRRFIGSEPIHAKPPTPIMCMRKWAIRHKGVARATAVFLLLTLLGSTFGSLMLWEEQKVTLAALDQASEQRQLAVRRELEAQKRLAQLETGNEMIASIFKGLNPDEVDKDGRPLNAIIGERLEEAINRLEGEAIGDPVVVARMQLTLAISLRGLGYPAKAVEVLTKARETFTTELGRDHRTTLSCTAHLGDGYWADGKYAIAVQHLKVAFERCKATLGADHSSTLLVSLTLAEAYLSVGELQLALQMSNEILQRLKATLGSRHEHCLRAMSILAKCYVADGKPDLAISLLKDVVEVRKSVLGPNHSSTRNVADQLADAYREAGRLDLAKPLYEEVLKSTETRLGLDHPATLVAMNNLAVWCLAAGEIDRATRLLTESHDRFIKKLGPKHRDTLTCALSLAAAYRAAGNSKTAISICEESVKVMKETLGPDHPDTRTGESYLALGYNQNGEPKRALPLFAGVYESRKMKFGPDHPDTLAALSHLAAAYLDVGKPNEAFPLFEDVLNRMKVKLGSDHPTTLHITNNFANCCDAVGKNGQALALYEEALKGLKIRLGADHYDTVTCMHNLAATYRKDGKLNLAFPLIEEVVRVSRARLGPDHRSTLNFERELSHCHRDAGNKDRAVQMLEDVLGRMKAKLGVDDDLTLTCMVDLAGAYRDNAERERAILRYEEALRVLTAKQGSLAPTKRTAGIVIGLVDCNEELNQFDKAEPWRRKWTAIVKEHFGADSPAYSGELAALGFNLLTQQKYADAEPVLRESLTIREKNEPVDWRTFNTKSMLGCSFLGQKKHAEAEPLLLTGYEGIKEHEARIPPPVRDQRLTEAVERLVQLYEAQGKNSESNEWRKKLPKPESPEIPEKKKD